METIMEKETCKPILDQLGLEYERSEKLFDVKGEPEKLLQLIAELDKMGYICDNEDPFLPVFFPMMKEGLDNDNLKIGKEKPVRILVFEFGEVQSGYFTLERSNENG